MAAPTPNELRVAGAPDINIIDPYRFFNRNPVVMTGNLRFNYDDDAFQGVTLFKRITTSDVLNENFIHILPYMIIVKGVVVNSVVKKIIDDVNNLDGLREIFDFILNTENLILQGFTTWDEEDEHRRMVENMTITVEHNMRNLRRRILLYPEFSNITVFARTFIWLKLLHILPEDYEINFSHFRFQNARTFRIFEYLDIHNRNEFTPSKINEDGEFIINVNNFYRSLALTIHDTPKMERDNFHYNNLDNLRDDILAFYTDQHETYVNTYAEFYKRSYIILFDLFSYYYSQKNNDEIREKMSIILDLVFFLSRKNITRTDFMGDYEEINVIQKNAAENFLRKYKYDVYNINYRVPVKGKQDYIIDLSEYLATLVASLTEFTGNFMEHFQE